MATKTIITTRTIHVKDEAKSTPLVYDQFGGLVSGKTVVNEYLPGQQITLDAKEADDIIARFGGTVVETTTEPGPVNPPAPPLPPKGKDEK